MSTHFPSLSPEAFMVAASKMLRRPRSCADTVMQRRFRGMFGVSPNVCAAIWRSLANEMPTGASPTHLLWILLFLKTYGTEHVNSAIAGVDEKTFRKCTWKFIEVISDMPVVSCPNLFTFYSNFYNMFSYPNT